MRMLRNHTDHVCFEAERVARGNHTADSRTAANRHIHGIQVVDMRKEFQRVGGDTADEFFVKWRNDDQVFLFGNAKGLDTCVIVVLPELDQLRTECAHRFVLFF